MDLGVKIGTGSRLCDSVSVMPGDDDTLLYLHKKRALLSNPHCFLQADTDYLVDSIDSFEEKYQLI